MVKKERLHELAHEELAGVDELSSRVFRAFITALRLHRRLMIGAMADRDMHPGQAFCLRLLTANDGIAQRDLAAGLDIAPPTASKMLHGLEKAGLVRRRTDAKDQRLTRVYITPEGRDLEARLHEVAAAYVNDTIAALPEADRRDLERLLGELNERLSAVIGARRQREHTPGGEVVTP
jgi:MarR family transcriptional regulator, organic hydroperoxide resistance regulator